MPAFNLISLKFPEGTSVSAYPVSNWPEGRANESAAPVGTATDTKVVTAGVAAFAGLLAQREYVAYALVSGQHRYEHFIIGGGLPKAGAHVFHSADIVIPNTLATLLTGSGIFDSVEYDTDGMYNPAQPDRLTIRTPGVYAIAGRGSWAPNSTGARDLTIKLNFAGGATGGIAFSGGQTPPIGSFVGFGHTPVAIHPLVAGDFVQLSAYQTSGAALNLSRQQRQSVEFTATRLD